MIIAWILARYRFAGKKVIDAMVDLPFALPTAVAGIALTALYAPDGWIGQFLAPLGIKVAFTPIGILIALLFVGLPFIVRTVEPILQDAEKELEEASLSLGATRWQTFYKVILPSILPALLTGFAMAFARGLGEYDYAGATAVACVMLVISFVLLFLINWLQHWAGKDRAKI